MNPTNKPLTITIGGERHKLYFDLNTFAAFEEATGKFFFDFLANLSETLQEAAKSANAEAVGFAILRKVALKDIRDFLWAAMHVYKGDEPEWPHTRGQIGRMVDVNNVMAILPALLRANADNSPDQEDVARPPEPKAENSAHPSGGSGFGPSDDAILASMTLKSDG